MKKFFLLLILFTIVFSSIKVDAKIIEETHKFDDTVINYLDDNGGSVSCDGLITSDVLDLIQEILGYFRILGPIALIIFIAVDFTTAVLSQDESVMKKAQSKTVSRAIALVLLILVPTLVRLILNLPGIRDAIVIPDDPLCGTMASAPNSEYNYIIE